MTKGKNKLYRPNGGYLIPEDMRNLFSIGDTVRALRFKTDKEGRGCKEEGVVYAVTQHLVIVQFRYSRESYTYFDYAQGNVA